MKKIFIVFCVFYSTSCFCEDPPYGVSDHMADIGYQSSVRGQVLYNQYKFYENIILFRINGKIYYVKDKDALEALVNKAQTDPCLKRVFGGGIKDLWDRLMESCHANRNNLIAKVESLGDKSVLGKIRGSGGVEYAKHKVKSKLNIDQYDLYEACLVDSELLSQKIDELQKVSYPISITTDIDACIKSIKFDPNTQSCGIEPTITNEKDILDILYLNRYYKNKTFTFNVQINTKTNKVMVFNGNVLVACNNNKADYIIKPVYSGLENCQKRKYNEVQQAGPVPDGVYIVRKKDISMGSEQHGGERSWGKYRFPLIPAKTTDTFGRGSMYLHGTSDPDKHRSAGCISLGLKIGEFIDTGWIDTDVPIIVQMSN